MVSVEGPILENPCTITKILVPSTRASLLHRPRLVNFLHEYIDRKILLVSASAGYGKTSLLIDFAHETNLPVCWYSLDNTDADPKTFLQYIVASLRQRFPDFGARTLGLLTNASVLRDVEVIIGTLITEIFETIPEYFVFVLDDYQTIENFEPINHILDTLLRGLPENAHIILSSRTLPSKITLTRLVARQEIVGLGVNDLRFTAEEIRELVHQNFHSDLSDSQAVDLAEQSEGWITGILLTTHSLWQGLFQDLVRLQGPQSHVFNYLASEVLAQQSPALQQFLLDTSIFGELDPAKCDALLGTQDASETLHWIEQNNLFIIRLERENAWYRYHHLFQEFLQSRLRETNRERWRDLNSRAANLYEKGGEPNQAIAHFLQAHLFDDAARVVEANGQEVFDAGHLKTLEQWIDALPPIILDAYPHLLVLRAMILTDIGEQNSALELYARALAIYEQVGNTNSIGRVLTHQALSLRFLGRYQEAIDICTRGLSLLASDQTHDLARAHRTLGAIYYSFGNSGRAIEEFTIALELWELLKDSTKIAWLHHELGVAYRMAGNIDAEKHFQLALEYWHSSNNLVGLANTLNSIGVGQHRRGDYSQAIQTMEQAREQAHLAGQLRTEAYSIASLGDVYRDQGNYDRAKENYQTAYEIGRRIHNGFMITYALTMLGEISCLTGDLPTAQSFLAQAAEHASNHRSNYELGLTTTALGILKCISGNTIEAINHLERALELLDRSGAKREGARARLHIANAHLAEHHFKLVNDYLQAVVESAKDLHEEQFIISDGRLVYALVQYATVKKIGNRFFTSILERIQSASAPVEQALQVLVESTLPHLRVHALAGAQVSIANRLVTPAEWGSAKARELFFLLLAHPGGLRKEQILTSLWGDMEPVRANGIFHSSVYRVRRALFADCLLYEDSIYRINPESDRWYDVDEFRSQILQAANTAIAETRAQCYRDAVDLYQKDYIEDCYSDWCIPIRDDLEQEYIMALAMLAKYYSEEDNPSAIDCYQNILQRDPYREDIYRSIMAFQAKTGNRTKALKTYQDCARIMRDEMHADPSPETRSLYARILKGAPIG
jgi:LuxR family transcriptional regulator, maltose regulon positive regulatory protein